MSAGKTRVTISPFGAMRTAYVRTEQELQCRCAHWTVVGDGIGEWTTCSRTVSCNDFCGGWRLWCCVALCFLVLCGAGVFFLHFSASLFFIFPDFGAALHFFCPRFHFAFFLSCDFISNCYFTSVAF